MDYRKLTRSELEREASARARAVGVGHVGAVPVVLCRALGKYPLYVPGDDAGVAHHLILDGFWESWVTLALARLVRPGDAVADVGANCGYYSALLADLAGPSGRVFAVEPNPLFWGLLPRTFEANGAFGRCRLCRWAADDCEGHATLRWPRYLPGSASVRADPSRDDLSRLQVERRPLDSLGEAFDLIKVDAEGADYGVLAGARDTLRRRPPRAIVLEHHAPFYPGRERELIESVTGLGYELNVIDFDGAVRPAGVDEVVADPSRVWNLAFLRSGG